MNILLLSMPNITLSYTTTVIIPPTLALISLAGNLESRHHVGVADLISRRKDVRGAVKEALDRTNPDLVGLSAMTFQYNTALKIAQFIRHVKPFVKIALGGYHATIMYKEIAESLDGNFFDFIFRGESDLSFGETVNQLEEKGDLSQIDGLSYKKDGKFIHNPIRQLENINRIKVPNRQARLWNECNVLGLPFDMIESSRGCRMNCNFCNIRNMYGKSFRTFDFSRIMRDIENAKRRGTKILFFTDDNITLDILRFENLCDEIISCGHDDILYGIQASSTGIAQSQKLVEKMARAGFRLVFLGIENASKRNLQDLSKGDIVDQSVKAVKYLKENGILVSAGLIIGNPSDDYLSIEETFKFASDLGVDFAGVQFLVPYPKTPIRDQLKKMGLLIQERDFRFYNGGTAIARTRYLDDNELKFIKFKLTRRFFKTRKFSVFKALFKQKRMSLKLMMGALKILPDFIMHGLFGKIRKLFMTENQQFDRYLKKVKILNEFNI